MCIRRQHVATVTGVKQFVLIEILWGRWRHSHMWQDKECSANQHIKV